MVRVIVLSLCCLMLLGSCTQKLICPAYQSAFIYDQEALRKKFSYFNEDSTPKILTVSKNKYLIIPEQSYRKKIRSMKTVEMKPVKTILPDSLLSDKDKDPSKAKKADEFKGAEQDAADSTGQVKAGTTDSTALTKPGEEKDSTYAITRDKEVRVLKYNRDSAKYHIEHITLNADQDNYMWYFRDVLVLPDVRAAMQDQKNAKAEKEAASKVKKKKVGFLGFFKNLFKKKEKVDSVKTVQPSVPPIDSDNPADSTAALSAPEAKSIAPPEKKKKGLFNFIRKKKKSDDANTSDKPVDAALPVPDKKEPDKKDPPKKEDGF